MLFFFLDSFISFLKIKESGFRESLFFFKKKTPVNGIKTFFKRILFLKNLFGLFNILYLSVFLKKKKRMYTRSKEKKSIKKIRKTFGIKNKLELTVNKKNTQMFMVVPTIKKFLFWKSLNDIKINK